MADAFERWYCESNPADGGVWRHHKGGLVGVICRSRDAETGAAVIVYQSLGTGRIEHIAEAEWHRAVVRVGYAAASLPLRCFVREHV